MDKTTQRFIAIAGASARNLRRNRDRVETMAASYSIYQSKMNGGNKDEDSA